MKLFQKSRSIKGSVLVFSLIILAFMLVSALSVAMISVTEKRASLATDKSNRSFQVADTGVETMLQKIYKESPEPATLTALASSAGASCNTTTNEIEDSVGYGTYVVSFLDGAGTKITCSDTDWRSKVAKIKSEGTAGNTKRAVEVAIKSADVCLVPSVNYGGDTYDTVTIGTQCWMKQNMNVGTRINVSTAQSQAVPGIEKYCYGNNQTNCDVPNPPNTQPDGGLYQWNEAMQYTSASGARGICPSGWHIPTDSEWYTLENYLKDTGQTCDATRNGSDCNSAGTVLHLDGVNDFSANFAGFTDIDGDTGTVYSLYRNSYAFFWSSSEYDASKAWKRYINFGPGVIRTTGDGNKTSGLSVRCIQDS